MDFIDLKIKDSKVAWVSLNRLEARNALCRKMMMELQNTLESLDINPKVHVVILTGTDKVFAAGADIKELQNEHEPWTNDFLSVWESIAHFTKPIIGCINGYALGGGFEIAMMTDILIASDSVFFGQPEIKLALMPGCGGTQRLYHLIGKHKTMELCLSGRTLSAQDAYEWGIVNKVVPFDSLHTVTEEMATEIAKHSLPALRQTKRAILNAQELSLSQGIAQERELFYSLFHNHDHKEGIEAFLQKRNPTFKNN